MEFKDEVTMALEDFRRYEDDDDYEFSYGTIDFISTRPNSHKFVYSEEVIREYAPSVLGKWIIGKYEYGDMTSHVTDQVIQGIVPKNQEVQYRYEDGYFIASVNVVLSKLYSQAYNVLREDPNHFRNVSLEALQGYTDETKDLPIGEYEKVVTGFNITGITILGKKVNPSIPNANIQLIQLSEDTLEKAELEYAKMSELKLKEITMSDIMNKLDSIESKLSSKEEEMAKTNKELEAKLAEDEKKEAPQEGEVKEAEMAEDNVAKEGCGEDESKLAEEGEGAEKTEEPKDDKEDENKEEAKEAEMAEENKEDEDSEESEEDDSKVKMAELEAKLSEYETELAELRKFKSEAEMAEKTNIVNETLAKVKGLVDEAKFAEISKSGEECAYENIGAWKNATLASIADQALEKIAQMASKEEGITEMDIPKDTEPKKKGLWD